MSIKDFLEIFTVSDSTGGRKLKVNASANDLTDILTTTDPSGGRAVKVDLSGYVPSVQSVVSAATITPTSDDDLVVVTALALEMEFANPTGTWSQGQAFIIRVEDNGVAQVLNWGTDYREIGITLPLITIAGKITYVGVVYNATDDKFDCISTVTQA